MRGGGKAPLLPMHGNAHLGRRGPAGGGGRRRGGVPWGAAALVLLVLATTGYLTYKLTRPRGAGGGVKGVDDGAGSAGIRVTRDAAAGGDDDGASNGRRRQTAGSDRLGKVRARGGRDAEQARGTVLPHLKAVADPDTAREQAQIAGGGGGGAPAVHPDTSLFSLSAVDIDGAVVPLSRYAGSVVIVVNVASKCGFTDENYVGLQALYEKYHDKGLEILAFPSNQFGQQEPGSESDIKAFCSSKYHVSFPMFSKVDVNGPGTHPVFALLKRDAPVADGGGGGSGPGADIAWNFFKFFVDASGRPVRRLPQNYNARAIEDEVVRLLAERGAPALDAAGGGSGTQDGGTAGAAGRSPAALSPVPIIGNEQVEEKAPDDGGGGGGDAGDAPASGGLFALSATDIDGNVVPLSRYAGKVIIVVNVASACGFTNENYAGLQKTYEKYRDHGLEILAFPCNQFGNQEAGSEADIKEFCTSRYHVTFPMFSKVEVNGGGVHPVYEFLKRELPVAEGGGGGSGPGRDLGWNFFKFFVNKRGRPVALLPQSFDAAAVEQVVYRLLHE